MSGVKFENRNGDLFIDGKRVIKAWESFSGWYWFATEFSNTQDSVLGDGVVVENDKIYFGFVQGLEEEWGYFSEGEIMSLSPRTWPIKACDLPYAGRRGTNC